MPDSDPSAELLTELQISEGGESCLGQSNTSIQEIGATHVSSHTSNKETCADTLTILPSQTSLFTKVRKWKAMPANSSYGGTVSIQVQNGYKNGASLRSR